MQICTLVSVVVRRLSNDSLERQWDKHFQPKLAVIAFSSLLSVPRHKSPRTFVIELTHCRHVLVFPLFSSSLQEMTVSLHAYVWHTTISHKLFANLNAFSAALHEETTILFPFLTLPFSHHFPCLTWRPQQQQQQKMCVFVGRELGTGDRRFFPHFTTRKFRVQSLQVVKPFPAAFEARRHPDSSSGQRNNPCQTTV